MVLPPRGVEGSAVDGIGGGAFLWFFLVAVDKKEQGEGIFSTPLLKPRPRGEGNCGQYKLNSSCRITHSVHIERFSWYSAK